jgi:hypothetical protein
MFWNMMLGVRVYEHHSNIACDADSGCSSKWLGMQRGARMAAPVGASDLLEHFEETDSWESAA